MAATSDTTVVVCSELPLHKYKCKTIFRTRATLLPRQTSKQRRTKYGVVRGQSKCIIKVKFSLCLCTQVPAASVATQEATSPTQRGSHVFRWSSALFPASVT
jgi:hypothetical protein